MEFLLTSDNINVFARRATAKSPIKQGNTFAFDGDEPIEFADADSILQFFFPKDYAHAVGDSLTGFANRTSLRRYIYSQGGKHYMLVGVPYSWITGSPTGTLIIDPTTSVGASDDVWLEDASNYDGNGAGLLIGKAAAPFLKKRTTIKFNIAGSGIPSNATVLNAQMKLYYYSANNGGSGAWIDRWVQAHQLLVNWAEAQATSINRLTGTPWNVSYVGLNDIDAKSSMESTLLCQQNYPRWQSWDLTGLTQKWVNLTATNYGVVLWATNESTDGYDLRFYSSEAVAPNDIYRPYLQVTYSTETTTKTVYFLKDHLGSIRATVLDSATAPVIGYDDYDSWGYALALRTKGIPNAYLQGASRNKFTGKEWDDEFGLNWNYFGARYYDPQIGRWMVVDPLADRFPDISPFHYTHNNPLNRTDPTGLADDEDDKNRKAKAGAQGATIAAGKASNQAANARQEYHDTVSKLDKKDSAGRKVAREVATEKTPEPFKSMAKLAQSKRGDQTGGTANKSNVVLDQRMKVVGAVGKGLLVVGAVTSVVNIATADDKPRAVVGEVGTWTGALVGGKLGAEAGAAIGGGVGAFFGGVGAAPGAVIGGIIGGLGGSIYGGIKVNEIATGLYDDFKN